LPHLFFLAVFQIAAQRGIRAIRRLALRHLFKLALLEFLQLASKVASCLFAWIGKARGQS